MHEKLGKVVNSKTVYGVRQSLCDVTEKLYTKKEFCSFVSNHWYEEIPCAFPPYITVSVSSIYRNVLFRDCETVLSFTLR